MSRAWHTWVPAILFFTYFLGGLPLFALSLRKHRMIKDDRIEARRGSALVPKWLIYYLMWVITPFERLLVRSKISPNLVTFTGLVVSSLAAVALAYGFFDLGGWAYLFVGILDICDGRVARATGRVSKSGAFYDSVIDRYAEFAVFTGLVVYYRSSGVLYVILAALVGSFMVSYTRARAESLGAGGDAMVGLMQRPERVVLLGVALAISPFVTATYAHEPHPSYEVAAVAILLLAVTANFTALRRFWTVFCHLRAEDLENHPAPRPAPVTSPEPSGRNPRANAPGVPTT